MEKDEKEILEISKKLSRSGRSELKTYAKIILKAEAGIKKEYGLNKPPLQTTR